MDISKDHLPDLMNIMKSISNKWKAIGLQLKVKQQNLDDIENNPALVQEGPDGFLREALNLMEKPTMKTLISALRSPSISEDDIAQSIEECLNKG